MVIGWLFDDGFLDIDEIVALVAKSAGLPT
jgi:hypothetical protein